MRDKELVIEILHQIEEAAAKIVARSLRISPATVSRATRRAGAITNMKQFQDKLLGDINERIGSKYGVNFRGAIKM